MEFVEKENTPRQEPVQENVRQFTPPVMQEAPTEPQPAEQPVYTQRVFTPPVQNMYTQPVYAPYNQQVPVQTEKKGSKGWLIAVCAVLAVVLVLGSSFGSAWIMRSYYGAQLAAVETEMYNRIDQLQRQLAQQQSGSSGSAQAPIVSVPAGDLMTPAQVFQMNHSSVVLIKNVIKNGYYSSGGTGSGFVLSADGYVVTNYHVVEGGGSLSVVMYDGTEYAAKLIGYDNANDVALLKVDAEGLRAVAVGDSDALIVGDQVAAIGNPLGELTSTMTVGYVSAKERDVNTSGFAINMIQTDAAINSGNSGGPLFNMYGQVIGITSAKYSGSSSSGATIEGIGFAIPINDVLPLINDLMTNGYDTGPYLGISVSDMDAEGAAYYGLPMGAYVSEVVRGSCAEKGGIQAKDIITDLGGNAVTNVNELSRALRNFKAGDTVDVTVVRSGQEIKLSVTLDQKPQQTETTVVPDQQEQSGQNDWFGGFIPGYGG